MRRIVSLLTAALLMTAMLLTLPAASASAQTFRDFDLDDLGNCIGCSNFGFAPQGQFVGGFDGDFDADDFGIDEDDLDDCDFDPVFGVFICD